MIFFITLISSVICDELKLAILAFRHGDRSPVRFIPNDIYQEKDWPQGAGQLSKIGMNNHLKNGKFFKARYTDSSQPTYLGLRADYRRVQVHVRSTDYDRTLMSAESMLAGIFPPGEKQKSPTTPLDVWQPIPVHTVQASQERMLGGLPMDTCPKLKSEIIKGCRESKKFQHLINNQSLVQSVVNITGMKYLENKFQMFDNIGNVWDTLWCEKSHNMEDPNFIKAGLGDLVLPFALFFWRQPLDIYSTQEMSIISGVFAKEMRLRLDDAINKRNKLKLIMYSGHDTTLAAILTAYKVYDGIQPPYATVLMFELWQSSNKSYYISLTRRHQNETLVKINLPGCGIKCPVDDFLGIAKDLEITEEQWIEICSEEPLPSISKSSLLIALGVLSLLLITSCIVFCLLWTCCNPRSQQNDKDKLLREELLGDHDDHDDHDDH